MFEELLADLDSNGVRYVVVGGVAVVLHGFARLTVDIDLVIDLEAGNVLRCIDTLQARGLRPLVPVDARQFADPNIRREWIETRNLQVFTMRDERNPLLVVDLFAEEPLPFEQLWTAATVIRLHGHDIRVASPHHLIAMKRAAGRAQDLQDIEKLERIAAQRDDET